MGGEPGLVERQGVGAATDAGLEVLLASALRLAPALAAGATAVIQPGGSIRDDEVIAAADERGIAMVFQSYALYPHMTVYENLAYGLKNRRTPAAEIARRVDEAARMLELGVYVIGFSFPVVPRGQARIRTQMSAAHTFEQIDQTVAAFTTAVSIFFSLGHRHHHSPVLPDNTPNETERYLRKYRG